MEFENAFGCVEIEFGNKRKHSKKSFGFVTEEIKIKSMPYKKENIKLNRYYNLFDAINSFLYL